MLSVSSPVLVTSEPILQGFKFLVRSTQYGGTTAPLESTSWRQCLGQRILPSSPSMQTSPISLVPRFRSNFVRAELPSEWNEQSSDSLDNWDLEYAIIAANLRQSFGILFFFEHLHSCLNVVKTTVSRVRLPEVATYLLIACQLILFIVSTLPFEDCP